MPIISFTFDRIDVQRKKTLEAPLKVKTSIKITDLKDEEVAISSGKKDMFLRFFFEYLVDYQTSQGSVLLAGNLLFAGKREDLEIAFKEWKKTKKFNPEISKDVLNNIFMRCNIKALSFEQEVSLPPHIVLPRLTPMSKKSKTEDYIG